MSNSKKTHRLFIVAGVVAALAALAGCQAAATPAAAPSDASSTTDKQAASEFVAAVAGPIEFVVPGEAFDISEYEGAKIAVVTNSLTSFAAKVVDAITEASEAAGVEMTLYDSKGSPDTAAKNIEQAIVAQADAIVLFGMNVNRVPAAVQAANAAGIPVTTALTTDSGDPLEEGVVGGTSISYYTMGKSLAAWAIAHTEDPVVAAYQHLPAVDNFIAMRSGIEDGFAEFCPDDCTLAIDDLNATNFQQSAETLTGTQIARNPGLNWIFTATDSAAQFSIPAIELSGKQDEIRVGAQNALPAHLQMIIDGRVQAVDVGVHSEWFGWGMLDRALRSLDGQEPVMGEIPVKLFDAEVLEGRDVEDLESLFDGVDFRAQYLELWGK